MGKEGSKVKQRKVNKQATKKETRKVIKRAQKSLAPTKTKGKKDGKVVKNYDAQKAEEERLIKEGALTKEERVQQKRKLRLELKKKRTLARKNLPRPSQEESKELMKEALTRIYEALSGEKDVMSAGFPWIPTDWESRYRKAFGPYKKFLRSLPSIEVIDGDEPGKWTFKRTLDAPGIENIDEIAGRPFELALRRAWAAYAMEKKHKNLNLEEFFFPMPNAVKEMFFETERAVKRRLAAEALEKKLATELAAREAEAAQKALFDKIDTNHDGVISPEEFAAAQKTGQIGQVTCP